MQQTGLSLMSLVKSYLPYFDMHLSQVDTQQHMLPPAADDVACIHAYIPQTTRMESLAIHPPFYRYLVTASAKHHLQTAKENKKI